MDNNRRSYKGLLRGLIRVVYEKHLAKWFANSNLSNNGSLKKIDDLNCDLKKIYIEVILDLQKTVYKEK